MQEDKNAACQMRFPQKLWYLLNLRTDAIFWGGTGRTILLNYRILHNYLQCDNSVFKTTNISSFVRQLNLYGFRKVTSHLQDPLCNSSNPYMHEYVHDYFQFGRPELLNKITRKALTMKRNFKTKNAFHNVEQLLCLSPLQKARHALRVALKKAAQDLLQDSSKICGMQLECEDSQDELCEDEENFEFDWLPPSNDNMHPPESPDTAAPVPVHSIKSTIQTEEMEDNPTIINFKIEEKSEAPKVSSFGETSKDSLINFTDESCSQTNDEFPLQFLNMPDLDPEPTESKTGVELLAEFNIEHDIDQGIIRKLDDSEHNSLNCVLPSISNDQNDDVAITVNNSNMDHYNGEWDQMFNDMMDRGPNQECASDLKELYSQISKTIDLLNS